uniref:Uncharacterized protein n=1 Tax=Theropithecus gelada TaxID=9565 RepID=A0A8D2K684_THEGE
MLQEPGHTIRQSSHHVTFDCASQLHPIISPRDHLSPFPQRRNKTSCTLNHGYFFLRGFK